MFCGPGYRVCKAKHTIRVWAWFCSSGAGAISKIEDGTGDNEYINILEDILIPPVYAKYGLGPINFMHDRKTLFPSSFSSGPVGEWFDDHSEFRLQPWPPKSRDLNPFTTIWYDFMRSTQLQRSQPIDGVELFEFIYELFGYR